MTRLAWLNSYGRQRLLQIAAQILDMLDADRQAHQVVADAELCPAFVSHLGRLADQAFHPAQALGQGEQLGGLEKTPGAVADQLQANQTAAPRICRSASSCCGWRFRPG